MSISPASSQAVVQQIQSLYQEALGKGYINKPWTSDSSARNVALMLGSLSQVAGTLDYFERRAGQQLK